MERGNQDFGIIPQNEENRFQFEWEIEFSCDFEKESIDPHMLKRILESLKNGKFEGQIKNKLYLKIKFPFKEKTFYAIAGFFADESTQRGSPKIIICGLFSPYERKNYKKGVDGAKLIKLSKSCSYKIENKNGIFYPSVKDFKLQNQKENFKIGTTDFFQLTIHKIIKDNQKEVDNFLKYDLTNLSRPKDFIIKFIRTLQKISERKNCSQINQIFYNKFNPFHSFGFDHKIEIIFESFYEFVFNNKQDIWAIFDWILEIYSGVFSKSVLIKKDDFLMFSKCFSGKCLHLYLAVKENINENTCKILSKFYNYLFLITPKENYIENSMHSNSIHKFFTDPQFANISELIVKNERLVYQNLSILKSEDTKIKMICFLKKIDQIKSISIEYETFIETSLELHNKNNTNFKNILYKGYVIPRFIIRKPLIKSKEVNYYYDEKLILVDPENHETNLRDLFFYCLKKKKSHYLDFFFKLYAKNISQYSKSLLDDINNEISVKEICSREAINILSLFKFIETNVLIESKYLKTIMEKMINNNQIVLEVNSSYFLEGLANFFYCLITKEIPNCSSLITHYLSSLDLDLRHEYFKYVSILVENQRKPPIDSSNIFIENFDLENNDDYFKIIDNLLTLTKNPKMILEYTKKFEKVSRKTRSEILTNHFCRILKKLDFSQFLQVLLEISNIESALFFFNIDSLSNTIDSYIRNLGEGVRNKNLDVIFIDPLFFSKITQLIISKELKLLILKEFLEKNCINLIEFIESCKIYDFNHSQRKIFIKLFETGLICLFNSPKIDDSTNVFIKILKLLEFKNYFKRICQKSFEILLPIIGFNRLFELVNGNENINNFKEEFKTFIENHIKHEMPQNAIIDALKFVKNIYNDIGKCTTNFLVDRGDVKNIEQLIEDLMMNGKFNEFYDFVLLNQICSSENRILEKISEALKIFNSTIRDNSIKIRSLKKFTSLSIYENLKKYCEILQPKTESLFVMTTLSEKLELLNKSFEKMNNLNILFNGFERNPEINCLDDFYHHMNFFKINKLRLMDQLLNYLIKNNFKNIYKQMLCTKHLLEALKNSNSLFEDQNGSKIRKFNDLLKNSQIKFEKLENYYLKFVSYDSESNPIQVYEFYQSKLKEYKLDSLEIIFSYQISVDIKSFLIYYEIYESYINSCLKLEKWSQILSPCSQIPEKLIKFNEISKSINNISVSRFNEDFTNYFIFESSKKIENFLFFEFLEILSNSSELIEYLKRDIFDGKEVFDEMKLFLKINFSQNLQLFNIFCIQEIKQTIVNNILKSSNDSSNFLERIMKAFFSNIEECKKIIFYLKMSRNILKDFQNTLMQVSKNEIFKARQISNIIQESKLEIILEKEVYIIRIYLDKMQLNMKTLKDLKSKAVFDSSNLQTKDEDSLSEEDYKNFIKAVENLIKIESDLNSLLIIGVDLLEGQKKEFKFISGNFSELNNFTIQINEILNECKKFLVESLVVHHDLTYINGRYYKFIDGFIGSNEFKSRIIHLLKFMGKFTNDLEISENFISRLNFLNEELKEMSRDLSDLQKSELKYSEKFRKKLGIYATFFHKFERGKGIEEFSKDDKSYIYNYLTTNIFETLISFYYNYSNKSLPKPHQFIHCSEETSWHDLELFLYRMSTTTTHEIFTLIELEKLSFSNQLNFIDLFKKLFSKSVSHLKIFFLSRNEDSHAVSILKRTLGIKFKYLKDSDILSYEELQNEIQKNTNSMIYISEKAGMGKTSSIYQEFNSELKQIELFIADNFSIKNVKSFIQENLFEEPIHVYLNVNTVKNLEFLNKFLYNLTVFGYFEEDNSFLYKKTVISIEIESTSGDFLRKSLSILQYLKKKNLSFNPDNFEIEKSNIPHIEEIIRMMKYIDIENSRRSEIDYIRFFIKEEKFENYRQIQVFFKMVYSTLNSFKQTDYFNENFGPIIDELKPNCQEIAQIFQNSKDYIMRAIIKSILNIYSKDLNIIQDQENEHDLRQINPKSWSSDHRLLIFFDNKKKINLISSDFKRCPEILKKLVDCLTEYENYKQTRDQSTGWFSMIKSKMFSSFNYQNLLNSFNSNNFNLKDFSSPGINYLEYLSSLTGRNILSSSDIPKHLNYYVLTLENFMKMVILYLKIESETPIILMGETGCGKTALVNYFVSVVLQEKLKIYTINAGVDLETLKEIVSNVREEAKLLQISNKRLWVFLDEFNTSECINFISQLLCENRFNNQSLESNIVWVGACNPYKRAKATGQSCGLKKSPEDSNLMHFVQKIPHRVVDFIWDFGSITPDVLNNYLEKMLDRIFKELHKEDNDLKTKTIKTIVAMHEYFYNTIGAHSVSLRDIARVVDLAIWFYQCTGEEFHEKLRLRESIILSLVHCYYLRIPDLKERAKLVKIIEKTLKIANGKVLECLRIVQDYFFKELDVGNKIAKNDAFVENIYALIPCICNKIPIFICGKPGSSKTLATQFLFQKMKGVNSSSKLFKSMPEIKEYAFQGSRSCTSEGIEKVFETAILHAKQYQHDNLNTLPVIVFDEIGLAELSPSNPLKVLHKYLEHEQKTIGFIGLSNWQLDASKMNRTLVLGRAEPNKDDLIRSALSIASNHDVSVDHNSRIEKLVEAYSELRSQFERNYSALPDFYGHRDFYNIIGKICSDFKEQDYAGNENSVILKAFARNMAGLEDSHQRIKTVLSQKLEDRSILSTVLDPLELIRENLDFVGTGGLTYEPRYLMIIGKKEEIFYLINNRHVSLKNETVKIFGSHFTNDYTSEDAVIDSISDIIRYIERDVTLIFIDIDSIYPALYDLFNQNFCVKDKSRSCKITVGSECNPNCEVHLKFRCVVVVEDSDESLEKIEAPFLNRFEKQRISVNSLLTPEHHKEIHSLKAWVNSFFFSANGRLDIDTNSVFPLFSESLLQLFVLMSSREEVQKNFKDLFIRSASNDLPFLLEYSNMDQQEKLVVLKQWEENHRTSFIEDIEKYSNFFNRKLLALTYDSAQVPFILNACHFRISEIKTEKELRKSIEGFRNSKELFLIVEVNNKFERQHLYQLISLIDSEVIEKPGKNFVILIRMHRNDKNREFIISETSWDVKMYEKFERSPIDMLKYRNYPVQSLSLDSKFVDLNNEIIDFIEESLMLIKYTSGSNKFNPSKHKLEIIKSFIKDENLKNDFIEKVKNLLIKRRDSRYEKYYIKNLIFESREVQKNGLNLENSLKILAKLEVLHVIKLIVIFLERKNSMNAYINSVKDQNDTLRSLFDFLLDKINPEEIMFQDENLSNTIEIVDGLTFPLSKEIYSISVSSIKRGLFSQNQEYCESQIQEDLKNHFKEIFFGSSENSGLAFDDFLKLIFEKNTRLLFDDTLKIILDENSLFYSKSSVLDSILELIHTDCLARNIIMMDKKRYTITSLFALYDELVLHKFETIIKNIFERDSEYSLKHGVTFLNDIWKEKVKNLIETLTLNVFPDDIFNSYSKIKLSEYRKLLQMFFDVSCSIQNDEELELPSIKCLLYWKTVCGIS